MKFKENENICFVTTLKSPEKDDFIYFSLPTVINPPQAIITLKRKGNIVTESNSVSLAKLLENENIKIGIADRAYGVTLDSIIEKYKQNKNVYKRTGTDVFLGLLEMMENERIDYIIGTPYEVNYAASLLNNKLELISVEIEETKSEKYLLSYAGFPKTPWGKKVREQVDKILQTERETAHYYSIFNRWLDEKSTIRVNEDWKKILNTEK